MAEQENVVGSFSNVAPTESCSNDATGTSEIGVPKDGQKLVDRDKPPDLGGK